MKPYYIITSKRKDSVAITKNYFEAFDFIVKNRDAKVRTIGANATPRILDRRKFLKSFLENTADNEKFYLLTEILIKRDDNFRKFLNNCDLMQEYRVWKNINSNKL